MLKATSNDGNSEITGSCDYNPFLNTLTYNVEFPDGEIGDHQTNVINKNMHDQVDDDSHAMQILDAIVDHRKDRNVVCKAGMHLRTKIRKQYILHTNPSSSPLILWKNGKEERMILNHLKKTLTLKLLNFVFPEELIMSLPLSSRSHALFFFNVASHLESIRG